MDVVKLPISSIEVNEEFNCRGTILPLDVASLASDIQQNGLMNPVNVRKIGGGKYSLVAGFRRLKAHKILEITEIDAVIVECDDQRALIMNLSENLQRKDLNILQEANALRRLRLSGMSEEDSARAISASRGWVQVRFMLLSLPEAIQQEAGAGVIGQEYIRELYSMGTVEEQFEAVKRIKDSKAAGVKRNLNLKRLRKGQMFHKKQRTRAECEAMIEEILDSLGPNLSTRMLAWACGNLTESEVFSDLQEACNQAGKRYEIPSNGLNKRLLSNVTG